MSDVEQEIGVKQPRSSEEIQKNYNELCAIRGHFERQIELIQRNIKNISSQQDGLDIENNELLKQKEEIAKHNAEVVAKKAAKLEAVSNEAV